MASNVDLVKGIYEAFAKGDVPAVLGALDPKVEWGEAEGFIFDVGKNFIGHDEVLQGVFMRIVNETTDFTVHPEGYVDGGDKVVSIGRYTGSINATGRSFDAQYAHYWEFKDGKVVRMQQYTDTGQFQKAAAG
jgi:ketosteroid isomerase-like protein